MLAELFIEYALRLGMSVEQLSTTHQQVSGWYWSDAERNRLGRLDLRAARRQVLKLVLARLDIDRPALGDEMADAFTLRRELLFKPFPGTIETLKELQRHGIRMGLLTNGNSEFQRSKIQRFDLARYFEVIIVEGEFGVGKPDQRVFFLRWNNLALYPHKPG